MSEAQLLYYRTGSQIGATSYASSTTDAPILEQKDAAKGFLAIKSFEPEKEKQVSVRIDTPFTDISRKAEKMIENGRSNFSFVTGDPKNYTDANTSIKLTTNPDTEKAKQRILRCELFIMSDELSKQEKERVRAGAIAALQCIAVDIHAYYNKNPEEIADKEFILKVFQEGLEYTTRANWNYDIKNNQVVRTRSDEAKINITAEDVSAIYANCKYHRAQLKAEKN